MSNLLSTTGLPPSVHYQKFLHDTEPVRNEFPDQGRESAKKRAQYYEALAGYFSNTPLERIEYGKATIWHKNETAQACLNHYGRLFLEIIRHRDKILNPKHGAFMPGETTLVEGSTRSAGVAFNKVGHDLLGFDCTIFAPYELDAVRIAAMAEGAQCMKFPDPEVTDKPFLEGMVETFKKYYEDTKPLQQQGTLGFPNHAHYKKSPKAFEAIASEVADELKQEGVWHLDAAFFAIGNGTSALETSKLLKTEKNFHRLNVYGYEDANGASAYYQMRGEIPPPLQGPITLFGAGGTGQVHMPAVNRMIKKNLLTDVFLVSEDDWRPAFERENRGVRWDKTKGRTSCMGIELAREYIDENPNVRNVLTHGYDLGCDYGNQWLTSHHSYYKGDGEWAHNPIAINKDDLMKKLLEHAT